MPVCMKSQNISTALRQPFHTSLGKWATRVNKEHHSQKARPIQVAEYLKKLPQYSDIRRFIQMKPALTAFCFAMPVFTLALLKENDFISY